MSARPETTPQIGARVELVAGDLKGQTGVLRSGPEGRWQLYRIVLDEDGTLVDAARDRFAVREPAS